MPEVKAEDGARVAGALLDAVRQMIRAGYDELVVDAGSVHAGPLGEYADDEHAEQARSRRIGFHTK